MARPREFDRETALKEAIRAFADHGYEGTSTDDLMRAMSISRQSMYDTFGDKRRLYLEALQQYSAESVSALVRAMNTADSPLKGIESALSVFAAGNAESGRACLGVSAICEFGRSDPAITLLSETSTRTLIAALEQLIADAKAARAVNADIDVRAAAQFIAATFSGMKVAARSGASTGTLRDIARMAIRSLR